MKKLRFFLGLTLLLIPFNIEGHFNGKGHVEYAKTQSQKFLNTDCASTNSCGLKSFNLYTTEYEVWFTEPDDWPSLGTKMTAEYETYSVADLEKFAVVQFIKGCYVSTINKKEGFERSIASVFFEFFGKKNVPYCFPEFVIDSIDTDPVYYSGEDRGRHDLYKWNEVPGSFDKNTQKFYGDEKPVRPKLYVEDNALPTASYKPAGEYNLERSYDLSLEFRTCIYRSADVPRSTVETDVNFAKPIKCFNWKSSYVYNWDRKKFDSPGNLLFP